MDTLLLRLAAPMQSWGSSSKFNRRATEREPTKSGVIGIVAAALGRGRTDAINDLTALRFGVRIDQTGKLLKDFQTAKRLNANNSDIGYRYYLMDAVFLAGLSGDRDLLDKINAAIENPVYPLFLGRRSCPPTYPVSLGIRKGADLLEALKAEPWLASDWYKIEWDRKKANDELEVTLEIVTDAYDLAYADFSIQDTPISFSQAHREFTFRGRTREYIKIRNNDNYLTGQDPFIELGDADVSVQN